jgi:hypothetical protein
LPGYRRQPRELDGNRQHRIMRKIFS